MCPQVLSMSFCPCHPIVSCKVQTILIPACRWSDYMAVLCRRAARGPMKTRFVLLRTMLQLGLYKAWSSHRVDADYFSCWPNLSWKTQSNRLIFCQRVVVDWYRVPRHLTMYGWQSVHPSYNTESGTDTMMSMSLIASRGLYLKDYSGWHQVTNALLGVKGEPQVTSGFPSQRGGNAERVICPEVIMVGFGEIYVWFRRTM